MTEMNQKESAANESCFPAREPYDYVLIARVGRLHPWPYLMRMTPGTPIPDGWESVENYYGTPAYDADGRLCAQYWALDRYPEDFPHGVNTPTLCDRLDAIRAKANTIHSTAGAAAAYGHLDAALRALVAQTRLANAVRG